jgi:enamine deaminase RidA (YjgF/YER057c/UK114 family)
MTSAIEKKLSALGMDLPAVPAAVGAYVGAVRAGPLVITAGQLPWKEGKLLYTGKVGAELSLEQGADAARMCLINALAQIKHVVGNLDLVGQVVRVEGYVQSATGFRQQPQVLNGASELLLTLFGDKGKHTRVAVAVPEMPLDAPVQLALWVEV